MEQIARGNTQAFEELYDRYVRGCFGLAMKIVREPTVAEEVVQDVFMKLWSRPGIFSSERGKFSGWLLTLVHNRSVDKLRRLKVGAAGPPLPLDGTLDSDLNLADVLADTAAGPYDQAWTEEQGRIVREAIKALPHPQREAIVLAYFGGLTQKEIAERLQEPLGTVKTRTRAALQQLRRALAGGGLMGEAL
jgi:RNA polymerase sigma-70 factor (ECF subfamily)